MITMISNPIKIDSETLKVRSHTRVIISYGDSAYFSLGHEYTALSNTRSTYKLYAIVVTDNI